MGEVQRVFYFHVATGLGGRAGFPRGRRWPASSTWRAGSGSWDIVGLASVEIGLVFIADHHCQRLDLGPPDLEHLVDVGPAPDDGQRSWS